MADSIPASPGSPEEFDFDDVEAFETLLDDNDEAEARRTTWETENYSALVDIEKRLDEAFSTPAQDNIPAQQGGGGWDRTNTVSTARLTPHHADDALVSLARRSSIRLSVRDLGMLGSTTQREDSPNDTGGTSNLLSTTVARRTFLRSILGVTGASSSPGKRFRNAAASLMRSSRNTRESVCSDSITTPRGTSATSGGAAAGGASSGEGLPPMHNTPRTRTATAAIAERSLQDPTRFVDFVLGRLVRFTPTATGEATSPSTSSPLSPQSFVRVEDEEGGGVVQVLGNIAEAAKLIPVLANYSKRHAASVVPYLVKKGGALRRYIVPALIGLEQKFGVLDHRISNANGNLLMLLAHDSAEIFSANDVVLLIRLDKTQRKHFEEQEASSVDGKLLATVTVTQRSEASDTAVGAELGQTVAREGAATAGQDEAAIGSDMRQTSVYNSPLLITEESAAVTTGGGAAAFTLQHPRMFRVEWIPPLLSIVCATKPARFLAPQVLVLASTLISDTLQSLVAAESVSTDVTAETVGDSSSPVSSSRLVPILSGARQLSSISSEFSSATYLVSTISNALAAVSDPDEALLASDNGSPENGGEVGENKHEIKLLLSSNNIGTLFSLLLNTTKLLSALAAVACSADRELRRNITNMSLTDNFSSIPNWATIHAAASLSGQALAIAASATSTMTSATDVDLDHKEGVTLSCCLSLASSLTAALESFSDTKKRRDDDDDSGVVDVFQHRKILTEMLLHSILSTHFFSCNNTNSSPSSTSPNSGSPLNSRSVMKSKMEIQSELHSSLKALLMIPMIMEAVECLDKTDTKVVASFLAEGFADGAMQVFQKTLGHDFAASTMIMAVPSALDQMATSRLQSIVPAICEDLAPYLLGLEQCAPIVGASPIDLVDASRQAKAALQTTAVTLSMFIAKFISSPTSHEVQSSSSQLPTHDDDVVMVGTPSKDPAARSRLNNSSNTNHNAVAREASFSVVRCVTILRSLHAAATDAPGVFVSSSESIQNMTWALQWMHYIQQQMASVRRVAVDANVLHEALRSLHSRVMSLLITFSGTGQPAANDVMEGVVRLFSDRVQKRSDSESTASPCSVIVVAVLDLLQPEESIMTLSSAKPVVALALQLLVWFALSTTTTEQDDKDDDADDPLHDAKQKLSPWKFDGVQLADLLSIIALCDDGSSAACRKLAWKLVLHLVDDIFEDGVDANHRDAATKQRAAIGATDEDIHSAISSIELHFSDVACAAFPTSDVFASLVDMAPIMMMLHAHGLWPMKSNALSAKSTGGKKSKTTAELLSGITNKLVGTQRPGNKVSETLTIQCAAIVKILLDQVDSAFHSEWLTTVLRELRSCLSASSSEQEDAPLRVWPLTAVLCNTKMGEHWSSVAARSRSSDEKSAATTDRILLESIFLLRTNPSSEELLYVTTDDLDTLEGIIRAQQQQQSTPTVNNEASHRSVSPLQERDDTSIMDEASSPVMATVASPVSGATSPTAGRAGSTSKPPLRGDSPLTFVAFPSEPPIPSSGSATHPPEDVPFGAENSGKYRSSSPLVGGNVSDTSPRSFSSHTNAQDDNGRPASGGSRRRSKQFDNPQKMAEDLEALTKSLALKRYQLSEVTNKYNKAEALLQETRVALDNDTFHLEHVREAIECIDPDKYFSRDEVRRRQKVGDKSIKMLDLPLRKNVPLPAEHPPYDIKPASLAAKKSLDNLSDQFQRLMAAAVDTNDRNKLREAAATLTLERQLFEKEKLFYTKELDLAADIVWKKHSRIYELQLQADDLCRDADMYKKLQVDFRGLEENCTYLKNILDQYNMHLVAGTERAIILKRRRASSAHRVISTGRRTSNGNSTSPRELLAEEDSFEIGEDNDDGPVVVPPPAVSARNGSSSTLAPANGSRPSSAQATSRPSSALRPPLQHGDAAHNATSGTVTPSITPSGGAAPGASAAGQAKAWSEKMKLEFGLRSANTRIQRLQQEISKIIVERNAAILEAVDARQKTKFVELMHKSDVHGMAWAEQRIRRLEREKELYVNETRKANETLRETAEASQKKIEAMQTQLNKVEADRIQVVTTLALELDTARQRITELSGDCRRKDMMITQLTNKLELLRGGGGGATKDNSTSSAYQPARAMSASPGRSQSVSRASVFGSPVSPIQSKHNGTSSSPLKKQSQPFSQNSQMMPSGIAMSRNEGNNSMLDNVIDKRQDPHLKNFFAWKDMQRHRRMKQR